MNLHLPCLRYLTLLPLRALILPNALRLFKFLIRTFGISIETEMLKSWR